MKCLKCGNKQLFIESCITSDVDGEEYSFYILQTKDKQGYDESVNSINSFIIGKLRMLETGDDFTIICARCGAHGSFD